MKRVLIVAVVLGMIGAGLAWADPAGVPSQAKKPVQVGFVLQCQPYGAAEFVNDVQIWNKGTKPVPSGTKVHWEVMNGQWKGNYTFAASLAPGAKVVLTNVMNGAQSQGNCTVKVVEPLHMQIKPENMRLMKLQAPDPRYAMRAAARIVQPPPQVQWKEIECGIFVWPPPGSNPNAASRRLFFVNTTGAMLPVGTIVKYEVEGMPAACCTGIRPPWDFALAPNPPTAAYAYNTEDVLPVAQLWTRPCKAWAHVP
ncbi:MAG: hypothetical protein HY825_09500 [Acidobacteria bacterium]|nr:hypothetical protein [Acidobacteriota bacterium]